MPEYGDPKYWDERYEKDTGNFDWYVTYVSLKDHIQPHLAPGSQILQLGCGNSRLAAQMYEDGYKNITNIDISEVCVNSMKQRYADLAGMKWQVMNACKLDFESESFDVIIDKGTLDAVLCGRDSFDLAFRMHQNVFKCLKPGGTYINITYGLPETRQDHFQRQGLDWTVTTKTIPKALSSDDASKPSSYFYVYIMKKNDQASNVDADNVEATQE
eukprot:TRINITY_DN2863_c1_g1_i3.p1 TRINITY_DN2863_c1_g1~~TRINITY_DN2863_c1_g1_i3.p1  ORF type:complete len:215 (+),score=58.76 TRINITY_DN2863_c1_g1_i3:45-689(+)